MDKKVSAQSFKTYRNWQRYILTAMTAKPKLTRGCVRPTLVAYCLAMASHGTNGIGCYASDPRIASELGMYDGRAVRPYRHEALRLGWFVRTGESKGRTQVLDIAIPADDASEQNCSVPTGSVGIVSNDTAEPAEPVIPAEPKHDAWIDADKDTDEVLKVCLGCEPLLGSHSFDELRVIHAQALLGVPHAP
jgi:hypothetical protein